MLREIYQPRNPRTPKQRLLREFRELESHSREFAQLASNPFHLGDENPIASWERLREHARHVSPGVFCGRQRH